MLLQINPSRSQECEFFALNTSNFQFLVGEVWYHHETQLRDQWQQLQEAFLPLCYLPEQKRQRNRDQEMDFSSLFVPVLTPNTLIIPQAEVAW